MYGPNGVGLKTRGATIESWADFNPQRILGVKPAGATAIAPGGGLGGGIETSAGPSLLDRNGERPWHPDSPMFWFGLLLATTFGLIGASTSIRVGPFKAAVSAGSK